MQNARHILLSRNVKFSAYIHVGFGYLFSKLPCFTYIGAVWMQTIPTRWLHDCFRGLF